MDIVVIMLVLSANRYALANEALASPPTGLMPDKSSTTVNPTMAIVLVCLLGAFFMICMVSAYFRHYAERQLRIAASTTHGSETGSMRSVVLGLDPAVISEFPSFLYSSVKGIKVGDTVLECAVCLNEFQDHETLRLLPKCSHVFHRECIDTWLVSHVTCPVCRADLVLRPDEFGHGMEPLHDPEIDFASTEFLLPTESKHIVSPTIEMPRSHSTGHSVVVRPVENLERYTLWLPNDERGLILNLATSLPTSPNIVFPVSFRSISVGSTRRPDYVQYERSNTERPRGETSRGGSRYFHSSTTSE